MFTVAIDGPAASGKGTISRAIAAHFGFAHLDTGLLYRAVGHATLQGRDAVEAARDLQPDALEQPDLRLPAVAQAAGNQNQAHFDIDVTALPLGYGTRNR